MHHTAPEAAPESPRESGVWPRRSSR